MTYATPFLSLIQSYTLEAGAFTGIARLLIFPSQMGDGVMRIGMIAARLVDARDPDCHASSFFSSSAPKAAVRWE